MRIYSPLNCYKDMKFRNVTAHGTLGTIKMMFIRHFSPMKLEALYISDSSDYVKHQLKPLSLKVIRDCHVDVTSPYCCMA